MVVSLNEISNHNFIICNANLPFSLALSSFILKKTEPYILIEDQGNVIGVISPNETNYMVHFPDHFGKLDSRKLIRRITETVSSDMTIENVQAQMTQKSLDAVVLLDDNKNYVGIVTPNDILKQKTFNLTSKRTFDGVDVNSDDFLINQKLRLAESKCHTDSPQHAIVYYTLSEPISLDLPIDDIYNTLLKAYVGGCNSAYEKALGLKKEDIIHKVTLGDKLNLNPRLHDILVYMLEHQYRIENIETQEPDANNQIKCFLNNVFFEIENDKITQLWVKKQDISEQKKMRLILTNNSELLKENQTAPQTGMWEYDLKNKSLYISEGFARIFEIDLAFQFAARNPEALFEALLPYIAEKDRARFIEYHTSDTYIDQPFSIEYQIITQNNKTKQIHEYCKLIRDTNAKPFAIIGTIQDISILRNIERTSWQYQAQFKEIFNNSHDAVLLIDVTPKNQFCFHKINHSAEALIGISNLEITKNPISDVFPKNLGTQIITPLNQCLKNDQSLQLDVQLLIHGKKRFLSMTFVPIHNATGLIVQIVGIAVDFTHQRKIEANLRQLNWALLALSRCNGVASSARSETELLELGCKNITLENLVYPVSCILQSPIGVPDTFKVRTLASNGAEIYHNTEIKKNELLAKECIFEALESQKTKILKISEQNASDQSVPALALFPNNQIQSAMATPIYLQGRIIYILVVYSTFLHAFNKVELKIFQDIAKNLGLGIDHLRVQAAHEKIAVSKEEQSITLQHSLQRTIGALGNMLETQDPFTSGNQQRVTDLAITIGQEYGLSKDKLLTLELAASVHDIGNIAIPPEILSKPSRLSDLEFALIKTHPEVGYQILKDIEFAGPVADIVRQHHEYLDGSGYPYALKENEILTESKILTVADIFESIVSHRPYRPAKEVEVAINTLINMRGIKLDPKVVDICINLVKNLKYVFPHTDLYSNPMSLKISDISRK